MTRFTTTIATLTALAAFAFPTAAEETNVKNLNSRIIAIEARLASIEEALRGQGASHSYQTQAMVEATNAGTPGTGEQPTYTIQDGDTLGSIARKHEVERADLLEANRLSEGQPIYIGETLVIPGEVPESAAPKKKAEQVADASRTPEKADKKSVVLGDGDSPGKPKSQSYTVVRGDTLSSISRKHATDVPTLKAANGLRGDAISPGQSLTIPSTTTQTVAANTGSSGGSAGKPEYQYDNPLLRNDETYGYYTVRKGDNLYALARDFFSSMAELQRLNRLGDSTLIHPDDELIVPTSKYNAYHNSNGVAQR